MGQLPSDEELAQLDGLVLSGSRCCGAVAASGWVLARSVGKWLTRAGQARPR